MSTTWDVYCLDCKKSLGIENLRNGLGLDAARALVASASAIAALGVCTPFFPVWFVEHVGHRLAPRDECGGVDGKCGARFTCGACGHDLKCQLVRGHQPAEPHSERGR